MNDTGQMLPFLLQVLVLVLAAAAIGFALARRLGAREAAKTHDDQSRALEQARQEREALADELAQARGRLSALSSEAERTRALAAGFRRRADELEASLRDAVARSAGDATGRAVPPAV